MAPPMYCPVCTTQNKLNKLILHQINLTTAVYLCEDKSCTYPKGHQWIEVNRSWKELGKKIKNPKHADNKLPISQNITCESNDFSIDSDELLMKIFSEFENSSDTTSSFVSNEFGEDFFDIEQLEKDCFDDKKDFEGLFNHTEDVEKLHINPLENKSINKKCEIQNLNTSSNSQIDLKNEILLNQCDKQCVDNQKQLSNSNREVKVNNTKPIILNKISSKNTDLNHCKGSDNSNDSKIKVIINKHPDCDISQEQILELLKKLPPSNGKTIVLNFNSNPKFKGTIFKSQILKAADK